MTIDEYLLTMTSAQKNMFDVLDKMIKESYPDVCLSLFARQPFFYLKKFETVKPHYRPSVMLAFFKDHVNIFTSKNKDYRHFLSMYQFTEKHTLHIYFDQKLMDETLKQLFIDALEDYHEGGHTHV